LDNLLREKWINFVQYLKRVKPGLIPDSDGLIEEIKAQMEQEQMMAQQAQQQQQMQTEGAMMGAQQSQPITLEEVTADMSDEEIEAMMNDPEKMAELERMGVV
jgi:hypothetical protein